MKRRINRKDRKQQKKILIIGSLTIILFLCVGYAAFSTNLSLTAKGNIKALTINDYIKDNLFALYDGIENIASGHGTSTTNWYNKALDLNPSLATPIQNTMNNFTASSWTNDNGLEFNDVDNMIDTGYNQDIFGQEFTFSFVVNIKDGSAYRGLYGYHLGVVESGPWYGLAMQLYQGQGDKAAFFYHGTVRSPTTVEIPIEQVICETNKNNLFVLLYF